jgi:antibiotic biosynthesis monooxygenase (ABM) superfamily enzyme
VSATLRAMQLTDTEMRMMARVAQDTVLMQWLEGCERASLLALGSQRAPNDLVWHSGRYAGVRELLETLRAGAAAYSSTLYPNRA